MSHVRYFTGQVSVICLWYQLSVCLDINSLDRTSRSHALLETPWLSGAEAVQFKLRWMCVD